MNMDVEMVDKAASSSETNYDAPSNQQQGKHVYTNVEIMNTTASNMEDSEKFDNIRMMVSLW